MSSGDTIKSGSSKAPVNSQPQSHRDIQPRPFIPKRPPPIKSVYSEEDYDENGQLKVLRKVPLGEGYAAMDAKTALGKTTREEIYRQPTMPQTPEAGQRRTAVDKNEDVAKIDAIMKKKQSIPDPMAGAYPGGQPDVFAAPATKHLLGKNKFDVRTPEGMFDHDEQYIAVVRTIENRHPDEDRILNHFAMQYIARRDGTYDPINDPPVVLSDLVPTCVVIVDKIFSRDDAGAEQNVVGKYVKKLATKTDLDIVPVYMGKPFNVPLHALTAFKYKDKVMDQIMSEFYESREESASEILSRVEADREGTEAAKPKWHVYDGISPQGAFGPKTSVKTVDEVIVPRDINGLEKKTWGDRCEDEDEDDDDGDEELPGQAQEDDDGEEDTGKWAEVGKKKREPAQKRGGVRRAFRGKGKPQF